MAKNILLSWPAVTIGVVYNTERPALMDFRWSDLVQATDKDYSADRNPFSVDEIIRMWTVCLETCNLSDQVQALAMPRPQFCDFNVIFPKEQYDVVFTASLEDEHDPLLSSRLALYLEVFGRQAFAVKPPFKLHNSDIRRLIASGRDWAEFIAPGAIEVFNEINGPQRVANAMLRQKKLDSRGSTL
jgi:hypothetical protein